MDMIKQFFTMRGTWATLIFLCLVGCSISLISKYDEVIDKGITDFQKKMDLHLIQKQRNPILPFSEGFYDSLIVDLQLLETRANCVPKNSKTSEIISSLIDEVKLIDVEDKAAKEKAPYYQDAESTVDQMCGQALKLELAKKRGE